MGKKTQTKKKDPMRSHVS